MHTPNAVDRGTVRYRPGPKVRTFLTTRTPPRRSRTPPLPYLCTLALKPKAGTLTLLFASSRRSRPPNSLKLRVHSDLKL